MSTGVSDDVWHVVVRQIDVLRIAAETELQDPHAWKAKLLAQLDYVWSDHAEILGDERQLAELLANRFEQFPARRRNPLTALGSLIASGNLPARSETAEVVHAGDIDHGQRRAHTLDPPLEAVVLHALPVVKRIAPELSGFAEIVRRNTRNHDWFSVFV